MNDDKSTSTEQVFYLGHSNVHFNARHERGDLPCDTTVKIVGDYLCSIAWSDRAQFVEELKEVVNKYQI